MGVQPVTYKNHNIAKSPVGVTPGGLVHYISKAYGDSTSDILEAYGGSTGDIGETVLPKGLCALNSQNQYRTY